ARGMARRDPELAAPRAEGARAAGVVAPLHHVAKLAPVERLGQQLEEAAEIGLVEFLERRELPEQWPEPVAELGDAGIDEALDRVAGLAQDAAVGGEARCLDGEHEAVGHLARPPAEALGLLRAVIGRVDLDRGEALARVGEFLRLREPLRIEDTAPGRESPPSDADADLALRRCHLSVTSLPFTFR